LISHSWLYDLHPLTWLGFSWLTSLIITISILLFCAFLGALLDNLWGLLVEFILWKEDVFKMKLLSLTVKVFFLSLTWGIGELILSQTPFFWIGLGESILPGDIYLAGLARWIGASGLCVLQILIGFWIFYIQGRWERKLHFKKIFLLGLLVFIFLHLFGGLTSPLKRNYEYPVAIWQTNIPTREKLKKNDEFIEEKLSIAQKFALSNKAKLLVAPEGTLSNNFYFSKGIKVNTLSGGFRNSNNELRSSFLGFQIGDKSFTSFIDKNRLVPIGEKIPRFLDIFSRGLSAVGGIQPGSDSRFFDTKITPPLAVAICYEISDGLEIRKAINSGAKLIITAANLDPYPIKLSNQFISLARLRSIENKKKYLLFTLFLIIIFQILLYTNNNQKTSFRYFKWTLQEVSIGKLISISFFSGLFVSTLLNTTISITSFRKKTFENVEDDFVSNNNEEEMEQNVEMPPQRDIRETQPTISVNYRVVKNMNDNNLKKDQSYSNQDIKDDWDNADNDW